MKEILTNKKIIVVIFLLLLCIVAMLFIPKEEKLTEEDINKIIKDSYLDILVDMGTYSKEEPHNQIVQEAAMRIACELNLKQFDETKSNYEYVTNDNIKKIVSELTGTKLETPITVDYHKYYYPYNEELDVYEIIPMGTDWIHLGEIRSIEKDGNIYKLDCIAKLQEGDYYSYIDSVKIELEYKPKNEVIKYQINSITSTDRYFLPDYAPNIQYDKLISIDTARENVKQYLLNTNYNISQDQLDNSYGQYVYEREIKQVINNENTVDVQGKLCILINFYEIANIGVYLDAYTGEVYGTQQR